MPSFRDNVLTWLFFLAAAGVAAVDLTQSRQQTLALLILTGIVYIAGSWAAVGESHRLLRGAAMFVAPLVAALSVDLISSDSDEARAVLAIALIASVLAYAASMATTLILMTMAPPRALDAGDSRWRFSLSEILGWMVVTAIASAAVSKAKLPEDIRWDTMLIVVTSTIPCGVIIALLLVPKPPRDRIAIVLSALAVAAWAVAIVWLNKGRYYTPHPFRPMSQLLGFVATWILCMRLDRIALVAKEAAHDRPSLKLHDEPSHDQ